MDSLQPTTIETQRIKTAISQLVWDPKNKKKWSVDNMGNRMILQERLETFECLMREHHCFPLSEKKILDIGCGIGKELAYLEKLGAQPGNLYGVDLVEARVEEARCTYPKYRFASGNADKLDFPNETFDGILLYTVFSSILDAKLKKCVADEAVRVLKRGGFILWYDFRYPSHVNRNTSPISYRELKNLFEGFLIDAKAVTVLPPLVRALGRWSEVLYSFLKRVPFLKSHYMAILEKP